MHDGSRWDRAIATARDAGRTATLADRAERIRPVLLRAREHADGRMALLERARACVHDVAHVRAYVSLEVDVSRLRGLIEGDAAGCGALCAWSTGVLLCPIPALVGRGAALRGVRTALHVIVSSV